MNVLDILTHFMEPAIFTVVVEGAFWFLFGVRDLRTQFFLCAVNLATNLSLNLTLSLFELYFPDYPRLWTMIALEIVVIFIESLLLRLYLAPRATERFKIYLLTLAANGITCAIGLFMSRAYFFQDFGASNALKELQSIYPQVYTVSKSLFSAMGLKRTLSRLFWPFA